jgi:hypothetical protein
VAAVAALTFASGVVVLGRMYDRLPTQRQGVAGEMPATHAAPANAR